MRPVKIIILVAFLLLVTYFTTAAASNIWTTGIMAIGTTTDTEELFVNGSTEQLPTTPTVVGSSTANTTYLNGSKAAVYSGGYVYAVGHYSDSLAIIDVSDPTNPQVVGGVTDGTYMDLPEAVVVAGKYAYVAASGAADAVSIVDISDKTNPVIVGSYVPTTANPEALAIDGSYLYVIKRQDDALTILDVSEPTNPVVVGEVADLNAQLNQPYSLAVEGDFAYVGTDANKSLTIINVSDKTNPAIVGSITNSNLDFISDIKIRGGYAYISVTTSKRFTIINITDPTSPTITGSVYDATYLNMAEGVNLAGDYAYVASNGYLNVIDISDPTTPIIVASTANIGLVYDGFDVAGDYAYYPSFYGNNIRVVDLKGFTTHAASIGSLEADTLDITNDMTVANSLSVHSGVTAGPRGISTTGDLSVGGTAYGVAPRMYLNDDGDTTGSHTHNCDDDPSTCCDAGYHMCTTPEFLYGGREIEMSGYQRNKNPYNVYGDVDPVADDTAIDCNGWSTTFGANGFHCKFNTTLSCAQGSCATSIGTNTYVWCCTD